MSTWTNITITNRYDALKICGTRIQVLEFELNQAKIELDQLYKELENIFEALKKHKEITLSSGKETIKARLVEAES